MTPLSNRGQQQRLSSASRCPRNSAPWRPPPRLPQNQDWAVCVPLASVSAKNWGARPCSKIEQRDGRLVGTQQGLAKRFGPEPSDAPGQTNRPDVTGTTPLQRQMGYPRNGR